MKRLDWEISSLESNPAELQRQKALDEIKQDHLDFQKISHELLNMNSSAALHLTNLLKSGKDQNKDTTEE